MKNQITTEPVTQTDAHLNAWITHVIENGGKVTLDGKNVKASIIINDEIITIEKKTLGTNSLWTKTAFPKNASREDKILHAKDLSKQGITQKQIGEILGVSQSTVNNLINDKYNRR